MTYTAKLIKKESYTPTFWSGGMATEITTYPLGSTYAERNFLWRLGFAKIDIIESTFSNLPSVSRHLMVTDGKIILTHENRYSKTLMPFGQDIFMGDWNTRTQGKCCVFNLMTREKYDGELIHITIDAESNFNFKYDCSNNKNLVAICFYPLTGPFKTVLNKKDFKVDSTDLLCINYDNFTNSNTSINSNFDHDFTLFNTSKENIDIIVSVINYLP